MAINSYSYLWLNHCFHLAISDDFMTLAFPFLTCGVLYMFKKHLSFYLVILCSCFSNNYVIFLWYYVILIWIYLVEVNVLRNFLSGCVLMHIEHGLGHSIQVWLFYFSLLLQLVILLYCYSRFMTLLPPNSIRILMKSLKFRFE